MRPKELVEEFAAIAIAGLFVLAMAIAIIAAFGHKPLDDYVRAVREAMQPDSRFVSHSLEPQPDDTSTFVTWTKAEAVHYFKEGALGKDVWVTIAPKLKTFCQNYTKLDSNHARNLTLRLEQRLGLPPDSGYDSFVEFKVANKDVAQIFRPCVYAITSGTCEPVKALQTIKEVEDDFKTFDPQTNEGFNRYWVLSNYYRSFSASKPYPWTSLGYTFDWAPGQGGSESFERFGESEFVVPKATEIQFVSATDTASYCAPQ